MSNLLASASNLSHAKRDETLEAAVSRITNKVKARGDLPYASVAKQLGLIAELSGFDFGRFLLEKGGLNGDWTHYVITHPVKGRLTGLNNRSMPFSALEDFLLNRSPTALATQQRFEIFKSEIQKRIHEGASLASIPCGLMADLLDLDFSQMTTFALTGIDLDPESIAKACQIAEEKGLGNHCQFYERDAWDLNFSESFDLITSNGLSIYESDDKRVTQLYQQFFKCLKSGGWLITSFLTAPPIPGAKTEWKMESVNLQDALLQKILVVDILEGKWQTFRFEQLVRCQLKEAGFTEVQIVYDEAHIFPTILARKPLCASANSIEMEPESQ